LAWNDQLIRASRCIDRVFEIGGDVTQRVAGDLLTSAYKSYPRRDFRMTSLLIWLAGAITFLSVGRFNNRFGLLDHTSHDKRHGTVLFIRILFDRPVKLSFGRWDYDAIRSL
jgi:hypothetical protein